MPIGSTISSQVGFSLESTPGTFVAPTKWIEVLSESLGAPAKTLRSNAIGGGGSIVKPLTNLRQEPAGSMTMEAAPENIGSLLKLCFGTPVTAGAGPYTHTYTWTTANALPSASIQVGRTTVSGTNEDFTYLGMMANNWTLSVTPDEYVQMQYDFLGRSVSTAETLGTPTWPTLTLWDSVDATFSIHGATEVVDNLTLTGANNLDISTVVGTSSRRIRQKGRPALGGSFAIDFVDMDIYNAFVAGTVGALSFTLNAGASAILAVTGRVQYVDDATPMLSGPEEIVKQSANFEFVRDGTDAQAFTAVLTTSVATV